MDSPDTDRVSPDLDNDSFAGLALQGDITYFG
jgi:hypothetical protein